MLLKNPNPWRKAVFAHPKRKPVQLHGPYGHLHFFNLPIPTNSTCSGTLNCARFCALGRKWPDFVRACLEIIESSTSFRGASTPSGVPPTLYVISLNTWFRLFDSELCGLLCEFSFTPQSGTLSLCQHPVCLIAPLAPLVAVSSVV